MATGSYRDNIEPVLRPALEPGETLLAASPLTKDPGTTEDVSIADELKNLLDPTIYLGLGTHPGNLLQQATFGRALLGPADSIAGRLFFAVDGVTAPTLAVTDAGIIVFDIAIKSRGQGFFQKIFGAVDQVATQIFKVPRRNVLGAQAAPQGVLRRGRILVAFVDGSGCALVCAPPSLAEPVVAAIAGGNSR